MRAGGGKQYSRAVTSPLKPKTGLNGAPVRDWISHPTKSALGGPPARFCFEWDRRLEPVAAVGDPPGDDENRDGRGEGPPEGQKEIGEKVQQDEDHPEYFFLHWSRL